jgi:hypothetical protein
MAHRSLELVQQLTGLHVRGRIVGSITRSHGRLGTQGLKLVKQPDDSLAAEDRAARTEPRSLRRRQPHVLVREPLGCPIADLRRSRSVPLPQPQFLAEINQLVSSGTRTLIGVPLVLH